MARSNNNRSDDNNAKITVFYLHAENISSDLSNVAQALVGAIRAAPTSRVVNVPAVSQIEKARDTSPSQPSLDFDDEDLSANMPEPSSASKPKTSRPKKPFNGSIEDIDWGEGEKSFSSYMEKLKPDAAIQRYCAIAAWFKLNRGKDSITSNTIHNAYLKMRWAKPADITGAFRDGSKSDRGYFQSAGRGSYAITDYGMDLVNKLSGAEKS